MATLRGVVQPSDYRLAHTLLAYWRGLLALRQPQTIRSRRFRLQITPTQRSRIDLFLGHTARAEAGYHRVVGKIGQRIRRIQRRHRTETQSHSTLQRTLATSQDGPHGGGRYAK